jgi:pectate lyase
LAVLTGFTLTAKNVKNVIIRNLAIAKVAGGDAIAIQVAQNVCPNPLPILTHTP